MSTPRANRILSFLITIFSVCDQYVQMLNHHYHTLWPYHLSLNRRGSSCNIALPVSLIVAACSKQYNSYKLASDRKSLDFYRTISLSIQRPTHTSVQAQVHKIMQLRFQATPINLNAQVDRNNNKLYKFKIDRICSRACLGLTLGQCQLEDNCSANIFLGRAHRNPSVHLLDVSTIHRLLARLQRHILHVVHLSYLNEMRQCICMNAKPRVA